MSPTAATRSAKKAPPARNLPKKLFYRIQEAAEIAGVKPYVLRYWETEFKELSPEKDKNDQRRYRQEDIDLVLHIKDLLYKQKFTIAGARQQIRRSRRADSKNQIPFHEAALDGIRAELYDLMRQLSA